MGRDVTPLRTTERGSAMSSPPSGWYPDPENAAMQRFWDGSAWTDERRAEPSTTSSPSASTPFPSAGGRLSRGLGAAKRLADSTRNMPLAQRASDAAATVGHAVAEVAKDPAKRAAAVVNAAPTVNAALDGAGVRNKKGKIKVWRVARAAARPRKTVARVGSSVASTGVGQLLDAARSSHARSAAVSPTIESIASEWDFDDVEGDLQRWSSGVAMFADANADDVATMRNSAILMSAGLKHCLVGDPAIEEDDRIVDTVGDVLVASLRATSPDGLDDEMSAVLRLALAVARRFGVQPEDIGGNGELDVLFQDASSRMIFAMALAPTKWSCDMGAWFNDD